MATTSTSRVGDLIFCRPAPGDWAGQLVASRTAGPYSHVQVRLGQYQVIEARLRGILRSTLPEEPDPADVARLGGGLDVERLAQAVDWLTAQVGDQYSGWDIAADALQLVLPRALGSRTPFLVAPSAFDCSHLAAVFAVGAGYPLALELIADLPRVSPNSLARALSVIK